MLFKLWKLQVPITVYVCPFTYLLSQKAHVWKFIIRTDLHAGMSRAVYTVVDVTQVNNSKKKRDCR